MLNKQINVTGKSLLSELIGKDARPTLTAKQFLGKEPGTAYFKPQELVTFAKSLRPREIADLQTVLTGFTDGSRVGGTVAARSDKGGRQYAFITINRANANTGGKYILEGGMVPFLNDYMNGKFIINFTLEQLVEEALNE